MSDAKIARSAEYYQLLVDRFTRSGSSPRQARVYTEIKQLVQECASLEEIQTRMKNEGYLEKPGQALYLDKMAALERAASENGFAELAAIYRERMDEVEADYSKAYATGYEQRVSAFLSRTGSTLSAFYDIFMYWIAWQSEDTYTRNSGGTTASIKEGVDKLTALNTSFAAVAADPYFRNHIELEDGAYAAFTAEVPQLLAAGPDRAAEETVEAAFRSAWAVIKDKKQEIQEIGRREAAKSKRSAWMVIPPDDATGVYRFIENEVEA